MQLDEARAIVREFVSKWTTQKLCEVLAFAEDGKMCFGLSCQCLAGVSFDKFPLHLRKDCPNFAEHLQYLRDLQKVSEAEYAYNILGSYRVTIDEPGWIERADEFRTSGLIAIICEVLASRELADEVIVVRMVEEVPA